MNVATTVLCLLLSVITYSQPFFDWAKGFGGTGQDLANSISVDNQGNTYATGTFEVSAEFMSSQGSNTLTSQGLKDIFIVKTNNIGEVQWAKSIGGTGIDWGYYIKANLNGDVTVIGLFHGTVDFDTGSAEYNITQPGTAAGGFILKLDTSGNFVSVIHFIDAVPYYAAVDPSGNIYLTGSFSGIVDFDPGAGVFELSNPGAANSMFILKLDAAESFVYAKSLAFPGPAVSQCITVDSLGNPSITGHFTGTADFNPGVGVANLTSTGNTDIFILKLDSNGDYQWSKNLGGDMNDNGKAIIADSAGNIYTTGFFQSSVDFDSGSGVTTLVGNLFGSYVLKLNPAGEFLWAKKLEAIMGYAIALDSQDNVYTTGDFDGSGDFDPGPGVVNLTSDASTEVFISKLSSAGDFVWAVNFRGSILNFGYSITADHNGNIYTAGEYMGTTDFFPGAAGTVNITSNGNMDIFLHKLSEESLGLNENSLSGSISVYPNPSQGNYSIHFSEMMAGAKLVVYNVLGIKVNEFVLDRSTSFQTLQKGVFLLEIENNGIRVIKKLLVE